MNNFYKDNDRLKRQMTHPMMKRIVALKEEAIHRAANTVRLPRISTTP